MGEQKEHILLKKALSKLLISYSYHPVLWSLYYTCRSFYKSKPKVSISRKIKKYRFNCKATLDGNLSASRDIFFVDDRKNYTWCELYLSGDSVLIVPKEWIPYIIARKVRVEDEDDDEKVELFLQPVRFCCRPVLRYNNPTVVKCESIVVDSRRKIYREMYHTGIGDCGNAEGMFYCNTAIYIGVKYLRNLAMYIENFPLFIYMLQASGDQKYFNYVGGYLDTTLSCFLKHMLVCKDCFDYIERFVRTIIKIVLKEQSEDTLSLVYDDLASQGPLDQLMVPYIWYFPDADYDDLFLKCFGVNKCDEIKMFMTNGFGPILMAKETGAPILIGELKKTLKISKCSVPPSYTVTITLKAKTQEHEPTPNFKRTKTFRCMCKYTHTDCSFQCTKSNEFGVYMCKCCNCKIKSIMQFK